MGQLIIVASIIGPKAFLRWSNRALALIATLGVIIGSAMIYTPGIGAGGWLMATIPGSPVIYFLILSGYKIYDLYQQREEQSAHSFGRGSNQD